MSGMNEEDIDDGSILDEIEAEEDAGDEDNEGLEEDAGSARQPHEEEEGEESLQHEQAKGQEAPDQVDGKSSRRASRVARLARIAKEATESAQRTARELQELREAHQRGQQAPDPRLEAERRAALSPEERIQEDLRVAEQRHAFEMQRLRFEQADRDDRAEFRSRATADPRSKKYEADVEKLLQEVRTRNGWNPKREVLYYYLLGQKVANGKGKVGAQRQQGQQNLRRERTVPARGGSDVPTRARGGKSFEDLYGETPI